MRKNLFAAIGLSVLGFSAPVLAETNNPDAIFIRIATFGFGTDRPEITTHMRQLCPKTVAYCSFYVTESYFPRSLFDRHTKHVPPDLWFVFSCGYPNTGSEQKKVAGGDNSLVTIRCIEGKPIRDGDPG